MAELTFDIHETVSQKTRQFWKEVRRRYYVTPSTFMDLIRTYSKLLHERRSEFVNSRNRLLIGLGELVNAESMVGIMQEELVTLGPRIEEKAKVIWAVCVGGTACLFQNKNHLLANEFPSFPRTLNGTSCERWLWLLQDTEVLLEELQQDQAAVDEVREIVQAEEAEMQRETDLVSNYAEVHVHCLLCEM